MPGTVSILLHVEIYAIYITMLWGSYCSFCFTEGETEVQRHQSTCPEWQAAGQWWGGHLDVSLLTSPSSGPPVWPTQRVPGFGVGTGRAGIVTPKDRSQPVGKLSTSCTPQRLDAPD